MLDFPSPPWTFDSFLAPGVAKGTRAFLCTSRYIGGSGFAKTWRLLRSAPALPVVVTGVIVHVHVIGLKDCDTGLVVAVNDVALDEKSAVRAPTIDDAVPLRPASLGWYGSSCRSSP